MEVIVTAVVTAIIGPVAVLMVGRHLSRKVEAVQRHTSETLNQVKNSHQTNFRDDVDNVLQEVRLMRDDQQVLHKELRQVRGDITGLRRDDGVTRSDLDSLRRRVRGNEEQMGQHLLDSEDDK